MKTFEHFNIRLKYKPDLELFTVKALSRLMNRSLDGTSALDKDCSMLYAVNINKDLQPGTSPKTQNMVTSKRNKFKMVSELTKRLLDNSSTISYIPLAQRLETVLFYQ